MGRKGGYAYDCGLFMGRFQPFHKGHLHALGFALKMSRRIFIGLGSSGREGTERNPLHSGIRIRIIKAALSGQGVDMRRIRFLAIPDFNDNDAWFNYIMGKAPEIQIVFSRNALVRRIFRDHGVDVVLPPWRDRNRLSATKIRGLIRTGKKWQDRVPSGSVRHIKAGMFS